jgi:membrane protease YdiL (CAAX protease family)
VAIPVVLVVLLGDAVLRANGVALPRLVPALGPLGDPTALLTLLLLTLYIGRRLRRAQAGAPPRDGGIRPGDLLPLAIAILGMSAFLEHVGPLIRAWTGPHTVSMSLSAPLYRLGMGGALLFAILVLALIVPRFRRRLREYTSPRRLRSGLYFTVAVLAMVYAILLWIGVALTGPGGVWLRVPVLFPASLALVFGQVAIAVGEEAFYRGLLQREVGRLFGRAGLTSQRDRRLGSILAVSALFAFQHIGPNMPAGLLVKVLAYSFAMSVLLGYLFDLTRNLAVCSFAHLFNNLVVLRLGPSVAASGPVEAFGGGVYVAAYLLVTFSLLYLLANNASPSLEPIRPGRRPD